MTSLPNHWDLANLASIVDPARPISYGIVQTGDHVPDGIPCIRVIDLTGGDLSPDSLIRTSKEISESYRRTVLGKHDLVVALRGAIGYTVKVPDSLIGANLTRGVALLAPNQSIVFPDYLLQVMQSDFVKTEIMNQVNGSALQEIPIGGLRKVLIPLPPLHEQRAIAAILSTWDEAITLTTRLIDALQRRKQALMQLLLTGAVRFPGFDEAWEEVEIGQILMPISRSERVDPDKDYALIGVKWYLSGAHIHEVKSGASIITEALSRIHEGDILYNKMWVTKSAFAVAHHEHHGAYGTSEYPQFLPKSEKCLSDYLEYAFHDPEFLYQATSLARGSTGRARLNPKDFLKIRLSIPSIQEQTEISVMIRNCLIELDLSLAYLELLAQQKHGLMQQLLTGALRVGET